MTKLFKIIVDCTNPIPTGGSFRDPTGGTNDPYKAKFEIIKSHFFFDVIFFFPKNKIFCASFQEENEALDYIKKAMKKAMKNEFVFKVCGDCLFKVYYVYIN
jgi:hypothetical protein